MMNGCSIKSANRMQSTHKHIMLLWMVLKLLNWSFPLVWMFKKSSYFVLIKNRSKKIITNHLINHNLYSLFLFSSSSSPFFHYNLKHLHIMQKKKRNKTIKMMINQTIDWFIEKKIPVSMLIIIIWLVINGGFEQRFRILQHK